LKSFHELLASYGGPAFLRQIAFAKLIGTCTWELDIEAGRIQLGEREFPVQLLGSEAHGRENEWLWAWGNQEISPPEEALQTAGQLRELGNEHEIFELKEQTVKLKRADGHAFGLIAAGYHGTAFYYHGIYEGGAVCVLITEQIDELNPTQPAKKIIWAINEILASYPLDSRILVPAILESQGFEIATTGRQLQATRDEETIEFAFDISGRLKRLKQPGQSNAPWWWPFESMS